MYVGIVLEQRRELVEQLLLAAVFVLEVLDDGAAGESALVSHHGTVEGHYEWGIFIFNRGQVQLHPFQLLRSYVMVVVALAGDALVAVDAPFAVQVHDVVQHNVVLAPQVEGVVGGSHAASLSWLPITWNLGTGNSQSASVLGKQSME